MASGFTYPPPPPPPPKRQSQAQELAASQDFRRRDFNGAVQEQATDRKAYASSTQQFPAGSYVNPNFRHSTQQTAQLQSQHNSQSGSYRGLAYPDRSVAGHKRKLDSLRGAAPIREHKNAETIPSVPSFGIPLTSNAASTVPLPAAKIVPPAHKSSKSLFGPGISQGDPEYSDSDEPPEEDDDEDDDADEEAVHAQLGNKLVFEYEGKVVSLSSEQDLARWQDERRKKFPTLNRVAQKEAQRRVTGEERKRLLAAAYTLRRPDWQAAISRLNVGVQQENVEPEAKTRLPEADLKPPGLGLNMYDSDEEDEAPESATTRPLSGGEHSDDEPPETVSSKTAPIDTRPACKYFFSTGTCKAGDACNYRHEAQTGRPLATPQTLKKDKPRKVIIKDKNRKKGIHELLVSQENAAADKLALQVIKHLGSIGFFKEKPS